MISLEEIKSCLVNKKRFWVVFSGDSITSSEWVHPNWREIVEYVLKEEVKKFMKEDWKTSGWGIRTFNFAYNGATTKDILDKVDDITSVKPDLFILMIGGNDPVKEITKEEHKENIEKIKQMIKKAPTKFVFLTDNKPWNKKASERYRPYVEIDKEIDMKDGQFINLFEISERFPSEKIYTFKSEENLIEGIKEGEVDYWHPNQLGNAYIAKIILEKVFLIKFDPEKYIKDTQRGEKYPGY